jgi:hypothetical protein
MNKRPIYSPCMYTLTWVVPIFRQSFQVVTKIVCHKRSWRIVLEGKLAISASVLLFRGQWVGMWLCKSTFV